MAELFTNTRQNTMFASVGSRLSGMFGSARGAGCLNSSVRINQNPDYRGPEKRGLNAIKYPITCPRSRNMLNAPTQSAYAFAKSRRICKTVTWLTVYFK